MIAASGREPHEKKAEAAHRDAAGAGPASAGSCNPVWMQLATRAQAKLAISAPDDPLEREADDVADRVMRAPRPHRDAVSRAPAGGTTAVAPSVADTIGRMRGGGTPLSDSTRRFFEPRFGRDFSDVRIHTGGEAADAARAMSARAFTVGTDIAFAPGECSPHSTEGRRLLAHELTHTLQQQPERLARGPDDNPLKGVRLALVQATPPVFAVSLEFEKDPVVFPANLEARQFLEPGRYVLSASSVEHDEEEKQERQNTILFFLPQYGKGEFLWIRVANAQPSNLAALVRAREYLKTHAPVPLLVTDATKDEGTGDKGEKGEGTPGPKFVAGEDWLTKELVPAVEKVLADKYSTLVPEKLIGYVSKPIQEQEGPDVSMIEVDKKAAPNKVIAGQVRVRRSRWVDQDANARAAYAEEVAAAVADKMRAFESRRQLKDLEESLDKEAKGTPVPAWVMKLTKEVEKRLDVIRATSPAGKVPTDLPDRIHVDPWGDSFYFRLIVQQKASDAPDKTVWNSARMAPALREDHLDDVDALVTIVRQQTALLRARPVSSEPSGEDALVKLLMPEIPGEISSENLNASGATATNAENTFRMSVRIDQYFPSTTSASGMPTMEGVSLANALRLPWIDYEWKSVPLTTGNAATLVAASTKPEKGSGPTDVYYDLNNKDIDQRSKITLAQQKINYASILDDPAYPVAATTHGEWKTGFSAPGVYLILCKVTPNPLTGDTYRQIFPPTKAVFPVRVEVAETLAKESVLDNPERLKEKQQQLKDDKDLSPEDRTRLQREIDRITAEETATPLQLAERGTADLDKKIQRFRDLRTWMIADRKRHPTTIGTATDDPFEMRLLLEDKIHDTDLFGAWQELYGVYGERAYSVAHLEEPETTEDGRLNALNEYLKYLDDQKQSLDKLTGTIKGEQANFLGGRTERPVATLVAKDTGKTIPLFLLVGETTDSKAGAYQCRIVDLTLRATPLWEKKNQIYVGAVASTREEALRNAFINYGEDNKYPEGDVFYRFPPDTTVSRVPNVKTVGEYAEEAAMILALIGAIAAVAASGGVASPGLVAVAAWIGVANAVLATAIAAHHMQQRLERGTFEMDADATLEIITVIASLVGLGVGAKTAQLGKAAQAAEAAGASARAAQALGQIQQIGRLMLVFDVVTLGSTAVVTSMKVYDDVKRIKGLHLPKAEEDALLREVSSEAMMQGAMLAFQTVMMARTHIEAYRAKVEGSRYKTLEDRGWLNEQGEPTEKAPPFLRAVVEGKAPADLETPPFKLEEELPLLKKAAEAGEVQHEPEGSEYDASVKIKLSDGEEHTYKRRKSDGGWCRQSRKFCFITKKDIDRIVEALGALDEPAATRAGLPKSGGAAGGSKTRGDWATITRDIQATIDAAVAKLRAKLGKTWLDPWIYGTKLHKEFADLFKAMKLPKGWRALVDQKIRLFGGVKAATLKMTVEEFLSLQHPELIDSLPDKLRTQRIGDLEPDLVLITPEGMHIVWDLAPSSQPEHFAKTIVYGYVFSEAGKITQIGESYYRWQTHIELNATEQARSQGAAPDPANGVVTLTDKQIVSLMKEYAGTGKPAKGSVGAGMGGAVEMVTDNTKVIGRFFDGTKWVETTNFSIHYSEDGLFIRPEAP